MGDQDELPGLGDEEELFGLGENKLLGLSEEELLGLSEDELLTLSEEELLGLGDEEEPPGLSDEESLDPSSSDRPKSPEVTLRAKFSRPPTWWRLYQCRLAGGNKKPRSPAIIVQNSAATIPSVNRERTRKIRESQRGSPCA